MPDSLVGLVVEEVALAEKKVARKKTLTGGPDYKRFGLENTFLFGTNLS